MNWFKIFLKIADITGSSIHGIVLTSECRDFRFSAGRITSGDTCGATGSIVTSTILRPESQAPNGKTPDERGAGVASKERPTSAIGTSPTVPLGSHRLTIRKIEKELMLDLKRLSIIPKVLDRSDYHLHLLAEGMRDVVLPGEGMWERLSMLVVISRVPTPAAEFVMHLATDGYYAGGLGSPPAASAYINSMEPKYYRPLDEFTKALASRVTQAVNVR